MSARHKSSADRDWLAFIVSFISLGMGLMCLRAILADTENSRLENDTAHAWLEAAKVMRGQD